MKLNSESTPLAELKKRLERAEADVEAAEGELEDAERKVERLQAKIDELELSLSGTLSDDMQLLCDLQQCPLTGGEREAVEARLLGDEIPRTRIVQIAYNHGLHWTHYIGLAA